MTTRSSSTVSPAGEGDNRRRFFQRGLVLAGGVVTGSEAAVASNCHVTGSDTIRVGLIGCGKRGRETARALLQTPASSGHRLTLTAMADVFASQLQSSFRSLNSRFPGQVDLSEHRFIGLDAWEQVLQTDVDLVILATPPVFRPEQFSAAVRAGKHVLMEKPVAVDAEGVADVVASGHLARRLGLTVSVGLTKRHDPRWQATVDKIQNGMIGQVIHAGLDFAQPLRQTLPGMNPSLSVEEHLKHWHQYQWLGGDPLFEQFFNIIDLVNWSACDWPQSATADRSVEVSPQSTEQQLDFNYAEQWHCVSKWTSTRNRVAGRRSNKLVGSHGQLDLLNGVIRNGHDQVIWNPSVEVGRTGQPAPQLTALMDSIVNQLAVNDVEPAVQTTLTSLLARQSLQSGSTVRRDQIENRLG